MNLLFKVSSFIEYLMEKIMSILCVVLLLSLFIEVVNRYIFSVSWAAMQFIIPFCFVWMCMIGAALAVSKDQHFEVDLLKNNLPFKWRKIHHFLITLLVLFAGGTIAYSSIGFVELGELKKNSATGLPMLYIYLSLLIGGILIVFFALVKLLASIINKA